MWLFPPMALAIQAGAIPADYEVSIVDENIEELSFEADLVAISANTYSIRRAYEISAVFRKRRIPVILGGNHPSILPHEAAHYCDSVVVGDGETVWSKLLLDFENNELRKLYSPGRYSFDQRLGPRRELLSDKYRFSSIETVRGCPYDCDFCSVTRFHGQTCRFKPLDLIDRELKQLRGEVLFLLDDNFIGPGSPARQRTEKVLELFRSHRIRWMGQASVNVADDPSVLKKARESGCLLLFIGFESTNPEVLRALNKKLNYQKGIEFYKDVIRRIHDHGISVMGSFIIGTDFDTKDSIKRLKDFIQESQIDIPNITHLTPYPGTKVYEKLKAERRLFNEQFWLQKPFPLFTFRPRQMTLLELEEATEDLMASFSGIWGNMKTFFSSLKHTRSVRSASYSSAISALSARTMRKQMENLHSTASE
ncbi:MAG: Radical SAM domain-containing protein [Thermotogales bacterium 46_20]|nr:MAG: Radical SAM domain-containing protein [Thermotogales bacterium 46_20]